MRFVAVLSLFIIIASCDSPDSSPSEANANGDISPELLIQDLDTLFLYLQELHPDLFHAQPKERWVETVDSIRSSITEDLSTVEFFMKLLPIFQLEKDGHTFVNYPLEHSIALDEQGHGFFPFKVKFRNRQVFLVEDYSGNDIPAYAKLERINGLSATDMILDFERIETMDRYPPLEPYMSYFFKHMLEPFYGWGNEYEIEYTANAETLAATVTGISLDSFPKKPFTYYQFETHTEKDYAVLDLNMCEGYEEFESFCDSIFGVIKDSAIGNLVIDLRNNTGGTTRHGDTLLTYLTDKPFTQYARVETKMTPLKDPSLDSSYISIHDNRLSTAYQNPKRFEGSVYVLTDAVTFSSATIIAATVQCYDLGTVIGQETGGTQVMYSWFYDLVLPNSELFVGISTDRRWVPCGEHHDRGIIPDIEIEYTLDDHKADRDLEMDKVLELISKKPVSTDR